MTDDEDKKIVHIGFSGTRLGMTPPQAAKLKHILSAAFRPCTGHHGDCVGADAEFHAICKDLAFQTAIHQPIQTAFRAFCVGDEYREPMSYLARNRAIVHECRIMFAAPGTMEEVKRSGTWYTIRYARKLRIPTFLWIFYPDGTAKHEQTYGDEEC